MKAQIIIGTRGSKLALWQADYVEQRLREEYPGLQVIQKRISTKGDRILDVPLAKIGGKGLFTKELEEEMLSGSIDLAVHSLKDMPAKVPDGLMIAAVTKRLDPGDALVSNRFSSFSELPQGARVGTSSLRRRAQLLCARPDLTMIDLRGNVIAFGGRIMTDQKPKYLNTSDTPVFKKSENLFSLNNAKNSGSRTLILCEGYMDVIAVNQAGFQNAVATLGTALTTEQAVLMKRYADEVIICYDADEAGQKATARAIPLLRNAGLNIRVLNIPNGKDPDEFIKSKGVDGPAAFRDIIEKSGNDVEYRLQKLKGEYNTETSEGMVGFLNAATRLIATISGEVERDVYTSKICKEFGVDKEAFKRQVNSNIRRKSRDNSKKEFREIRDNMAGRGDKFNIEHQKKPRSSSAEEKLIVYLVKHQDSAGYISKRLKPEDFQNSLMRRYYEYFTERINNGYEPANNITADFTEDERNYYYKMVNGRVSVPETKNALDEYIDLILDESQKAKIGNSSDMSNDDMLNRLNKLREKKG